MTFYEAQTNSPSTTLSSAIGVSDTTLAVENIEIFADLTLPNLLTLGFTQANSETVLATEISGNNITVTRGVDGTATDWDSGTPIARVFTAYDWNGLINDFGTKQDEIMVSGILKGNGSGVISTAVAGTDYVTPSNLPTPSSSTPNMDGTASAGSSTNYSRADHVHPTDTSRAAVSAIPAPSSTTPKMDGSASAGTSSNYSRADHVHPSDTTKQNEITVSGILKGDGTGDISSAVAGTDYAAPSDVVSNSSLGAANGVATLDSNSKVTASQSCSHITTISSGITLSSDYANMMIRCTSSSNITITIPTGLAVETEIEIWNSGTGTVTISPASSVTIECASTTLEIPQYKVAALKCLDTNVWGIAGV